MLPIHGSLHCPLPLTWSNPRKNPGKEHLGETLAEEEIPNINPAKFHEEHPEEILERLLKERML